MRYGRHGTAQRTASAKSLITVSIAVVACDARAGPTDDLHDNHVLNTCSDAEVAEPEAAYSTFFEFVSCKKIESFATGRGGE